VYTFIMKNKTLTKKFWERVIKTNGCWKWEGSKVVKGYGRIKLNGKAYPAHRLSWEIHYGPIPSGLCVCHKCDNPPCTNPDHLFLGTHADNQHDCFLKGRRAKGLKNGKYTRPNRTPRGETHPRSNLTESDIKEIRKLKYTMTQNALAIKFKTPQTNISLILRDLAWKHIQ
jgi:hypothetical protein